MAKNRSIKVISQSGSSYKATPTLTLKGQWLKVLGVEGLRVVLDGLHCRIVNPHISLADTTMNERGFTLSLRRMRRKWEWKMSLRDPIFAQFSAGALNFQSKPPCRFLGSSMNERGLL